MRPEEIVGLIGNIANRANIREVQSRQVQAIYDREAGLRAQLAASEAEVKLARERLGPAGWQMVQEVQQLRAQLAASEAKCEKLDERYRRAGDEVGRLREALEHIECACNVALNNKPGTESGACMEAVMLARQALDRPGEVCAHGIDLEKNCEKCCHLCGKVIPKGRALFCSEKCSEQAQADPT